MDVGDSLLNAEKRLKRRQRINNLTGTLRHYSETKTKTNRQTERRTRTCTDTKDISGLVYRIHSIVDGTVWLVRSKPYDLSERHLRHLVDSVSADTRYCSEFRCLLPR